jgi:hypothetical protein
MGGFLLVVLMIVGTLVPIWLFRKFVGRWGGIATFDEAPRVMTSWVQKDFDESDDPLYK